MRSRERPDCLSIIDPHRPDNNISAGTHEIQRIVDCFATAHENLQRRLHDESTQPRRSGSLLEDILGGNFSAYELQRQSLYELHTEMLRILSAIPPPPAAIPASGVPPPPPSPSASKPPKVVNVPVRQTPDSVPGPGTALRYTPPNGGPSTGNGVVGVHFAHRSRQDV